MILFHLNLISKSLSFAGNNVEVNFNFGCLTSVLKVKILSLPVIKMNLQHGKSSWWVNGL